MISAVPILIAARLFLGWALVALAVNAFSQFWAFPPGCLCFAGAVASRKD